VVDAEVGWARKSEGLRRIAARLRLGLAAFVFVDDSALEVAEVAAALPQVACLLLPGDPALFARFLARHWAFDSPESVRALLLRGRAEGQGGGEGAEEDGATSSSTSSTSNSSTTTSTSSLPCATDPT
jgi:predicted enzyme involved in methoxymalonyl-ACP biosynthesis